MRHEFEAYGGVTSVIIVKDKFNGRSKGSGFIEMLRASEGFAAIHNLNGKVLKECAIVVNAACNWSKFGNVRHRSYGRGLLKQ